MRYDEENFKPKFSSKTFTNEWQLLQVQDPNLVLTPRKSCAVNLLNFKEIMIMGGRSEEDRLIGGAIVFDVKNQTLRRVCGSGGRFESLANQCAMIRPETCAALVKCQNAEFAICEYSKATNRLKFFRVDN